MQVSATSGHARSDFLELCGMSGTITQPIRAQTACDPLLEVDARVSSTNEMSARVRG
jgi:hypothetical protein